jgi:hypothetical protein
VSKWAVLVVLLALGAAALATAATERSRGRCNPKESRTLLENAVARVYMFDPHAHIGREVWGCLYRTGRRTHLGDHYVTPGGDGTYIRPIALNGPYAARNMKEQSHTDFSAYSTVAVFDLRSGKRLHRWRQGGIACGWQTDVTRLVLTGAGSAAWLDRKQVGCGPTTQQVFKIEGRAKHPRLLDEATAIDPRFLELKADRVYWRNDGVEQSAPIR